MVSFLQRLALPLIPRMIGAPSIWQTSGWPLAQSLRGVARSKHTVAQDRRAAAKRRALKRAKRLGHS